MPILEVKQVIAGYGDTLILHGASISVDNSNIVTIVGPNGAGKSTLLKTIVGLLKTRSGSILFDGQDITRVPAEKMIRLGLAYVPQVENVFTSLTLKENLQLMFPRGTAHKNIKTGFDYVLSLFPQLLPKLNSRAKVLSGGERQMLAMARALVTHPKLVVMDEPTAALAPILRQLVFAKVKEISSSGIPVLMVEQNVREALAITDYGYVLDGGQNALEGLGYELLQDNRVGALYVGETALNEG